jgi:hypothetical protein
MKVRWLLAGSLAALVLGTGARADPLYDLYAAGKYDEAIRAGTAAHSAPGYAIAARAVLADAVLRDTPCLECLKRGEAFARHAVAADPAYPDGQIWLAVSLGYESRLTGLVEARMRNAPGQSRAALDAAIKSDPANPYAVSALGGWHIEIVHAGGAFLASLIYGASEKQALVLFDRAIAVAPGNVAVRYQIALSLAGFDPQKYRARIEVELQAAMRDTPNSTYETALQGRAGDLLALLHTGNADNFAARVHKYQGSPG